MVATDPCVGQGLPPCTGRSHVDADLGDGAWLAAAGRQARQPTARPSHDRAAVAKTSSRWICGQARRRGLPCRAPAVQSPAGPRSTHGSQSVNFYSKGRRTRWATSRLHRGFLNNTDFHILAHAEISNDFIQQDNFPVPDMQAREPRPHPALFVDETFRGKHGFQVQLVRQTIHGPLESAAALSAMKSKYPTRAP